MPQSNSWIPFVWLVQSVPCCGFNYLGRYIVLFFPSLLYLAWPGRQREFSARRFQGRCRHKQRILPNKHQWRKFHRPVDLYGPGFHILSISQPANSLLVSDRGIHDTSSIFQCGPLPQTQLRTKEEASYVPETHILANSITIDESERPERENTHIADENQTSFHTPSSPISIPTGLFSSKLLLPASRIAVVPMVFLSVGSPLASRSAGVNSPTLIARQPSTNFSILT